MKKKIINIVVILIISACMLMVGAKAATTIMASSVTYDGTTVEATLDELIEKVNKVGKYICKRATTLHTEVCTHTSDYCYASGYAVSGSKGTKTITYGNLGIDGMLKSGDAFDCDVDGTGYNHRFYYVTDLESNREYAVLIYSNNTTIGLADNMESSIIAYDSSNKNYQGPVTVISNLPTKEQWSNISLSRENRSIITETGTKSTLGGTLPTSFSYSGYAARLLTVQEINSACGIKIGSSVTGELDGCNYLMENTKYSNSSLGTFGYWLETPANSSSAYIWSVYGNFRSVGSYYGASDSNFFGVRPAIEILKSKILY